MELQDIYKYLIYFILVAVIIKLLPYLFRQVKEIYTLKKLAKAGMSYIDKMDGYQFEVYLKALLKKLGYERIIVTKKSNDRGVDIHIKGKNSIVIQAKRYGYKNRVGISASQEVLGAKVYYKAQEAWVITNSQFTKQAIEFAAQTNTKLIDRNELQKLINQANPKDTAENNVAKKIYSTVDPEPRKCPRCKAELVVRYSQKNDSKFFGCSNFPICRHTEPINSKRKVK